MPRSTPTIAELKRTVAIQRRQIVKLRWERTAARVECRAELAELKAQVETLRRWGVEPGPEAEERAMRREQAQENTSLRARIAELEGQIARMRKVSICPFDPPLGF